MQSTQIVTRCFLLIGQALGDGLGQAMAHAIHPIGQSLRHFALPDGKDLGHGLHPARHFRLKPRQLLHLRPLCPGLCHGFLAFAALSLNRQEHPDEQQAQQADSA